MPQFETFLLERYQSEFENEVEINLTESGVEPLCLSQLLSADELAELHEVPLGYNHTDGTPSLRRAIAGWYPAAGEENVLVTAGAAEANFVATWTLAGPGDAVVVLVPNFMQIPGVARALGAEVRYARLVGDRDWRPDLDELRACMDDRVRMIVVCNPNNPTGAVLNEDDAAAIVDCARAHGAWILADEIYRGTELDGRSETNSLWGTYERVIVTSSTSKALAHAGLRLGWIIAPAGFIAEAKRRQDYTTIGTGPINQFIAERLIQPQRRSRLLDRSRGVINQNIDVVDQWVRQWNGEITFRRPEAGGMVFLRYDFPVNSTALAEEVRTKQNVLIVPGDCFGMDGYLRIGIGGDRDRLEVGLSRIESVLRDLS